MPEIKTIVWNGVTYYQLDGKGQKYKTYSIADRARRGMRIN